MRFRVAFVVNPRSGARRRGPAMVDQIAAAARGADLAFEIFTTDGPGDGERLARAARAEFDVVAAVGGDGTANEVARGLLGGAAALAVVPCGSGNGLARDYGVSLEPRRAVHQIVGGRRRLIDIGEVDGRPFLMTAGFGIDARVAHRFAREAGEVRGQWPYFRIGLGEYLTYRPDRLELRVDGEPVVEEPLLLVAANTRQYGAGALIAPQARDDDGLLDLVIVARGGFVRTARAAARLFAGEFDLAPGVRIRRFARLEIAAVGPLEAQLDGEPLRFGRTVAVVCRPAALGLWVPG